MGRRLAFWMFGVVLSALVWMTEARAQTVPSLDITKLFDEDDFGAASTQIFQFTSFGETALAGDQVALRAAGAIYSYESGFLDLIADTNTLVPTRAVPFSIVDLPSIGTGDVAFFGGFLDPNFERGLFVERGGVIETIADGNAIPAGETEGLSGFTYPSFDGTRTLFSARAGVGSAYAIYLDDDGTLSLVAGVQTPMPGGGENFDDFRGYALDSGLAAFLGRGPAGVFGARDSGVYKSVAGVLELVADLSSAVPGGSGGTFSNFTEVRADGDRVVFNGSASNRWGIYASSATGEQRVVVDEFTPIPEALGNFTGFSQFSAQGGKVAFQGYDNTVPAPGNGDYEGLFLEQAGKVWKITDTDVNLDGKEIRNYRIDDRGLSGDGLLFRVKFVDRSEAVFLARWDPIAILDIKPGSAANGIKPLAQDIIPVALLGTDTFDAANVDVTTLAFGPASAGSDSDHFYDVNGDGLVDLVSIYLTEESGIAVGDREACVTGATLDATPFEACDHIRTFVGGCGIGFELVFLISPMMWAYGRRRRTIDRTGESRCRRLRAAS